MSPRVMSMSSQGTGTGVGGRYMILLQGIRPLPRTEDAIPTSIPFTSNCSDLAVICRIPTGTGPSSAATGAATVTARCTGEMSRPPDRRSPGVWAVFSTAGSTTSRPRWTACSTGRRTLRRRTGPELRGGGDRPGLPPVPWLRRPGVWRRVPERAGGPVCPALPRRFRGACAVEGRGATRAGRQQAAGRGPDRREDAGRAVPPPLRVLRRAVAGWEVLLRLRIAPVGGGHLFSCSHTNPAGALFSPQCGTGPS